MIYCFYVFFIIKCAVYQIILLTTKSIKICGNQNLVPKKAESFNKVFEAPLRAP
ncbi:hypothetical protein HNQ74_000704 [Bartonella doshiae]|uniref:Uncharacterized protein n=2 Tax=Bartonella doshiae TaxID=33044 RepID=A0A380ZDW6_BARDO|nr:hypothetical protein MCS_00718 [Bartonella doshiae NCTC 12862 = ATCC 700133]MBB6159286.1 hypothetical protein [Bartonella doshiae]SUV45153.1 Uncharacterised protein [Bartonella doshiae]